MASPFALEVVAVVFKCPSVGIAFLLCMAIVACLVTAPHLLVA